ncbi:MAG: hypothetical protein MRJ68_06280 [Nitrospira sp.]|nr:hypothetical protein [Nitrospira sp.]
MISCDIDVKALVDIGSLVVATVVAIFGILKIKSEIEQSREQRIEDLRWRKAQAGKTLNDEMLADRRADDAMRMLDYGGRTYSIKEDETTKIKTPEMLHALRIENLTFTPTETFIRDSFDQLFYHMGNFEQSIRSKFVEFSDVENPVGYYVNRLAKNRPVFEKYLVRYELILAQAFLDRFATWNNTELIKTAGSVR